MNVVRDRPDMDEVEDYLKGLGADIVTTDDKLKAALGQHHILLSLSVLRTAMVSIFGQQLGLHRRETHVLCCIHVKTFQIAAS